MGSSIVHFDRHSGLKLEVSELRSVAAEELSGAGLGGSADNYLLQPFKIPVRRRATAGDQDDSRAGFKEVYH